MGWLISVCIIYYICGWLVMIDKWDEYDLENVGPFVVSLTLWGVWFIWYIFKFIVSRIYKQYDNDVINIASYDYISLMANKDKNGMVS